MSTTSTGPIDIDGLIDSRPIGAMQWRVVALCFVLAMVDGFDAQSIAYVAPVLADEFSLGPDVMGQLISSALVGLMAGAFVGSPIADRLGRRPVIMLSVLMMGVSSLLTAVAQTEAELFIYRFLTGLGLGGVMPNINILTAEFAPARRRAFLMTSMFVGFPIGTIVGALFAAGLINMFGWPSIFVLGGVIPLAMVPLLFFMLPESPRFLALKGRRPDMLAGIVNKIAPEAGATPQSQYVTVAPEGGSIGALFTQGRTLVTLLLWLVFFANLLTLYAIFGWMPSVLEAAGFPLERAILATILFSIGGVVGGLLIAAAVDRYGAFRTMTATFAAAALSVALIGQSTASLILVLITLFLSGATVMGSQFGINAMVGDSYDTNARATALGWALAVGRVGAIIGPIMVGAALASALPLPSLFLLGAVPMLIAAVAVFVVGRLNTT
ncbi:MFS transporter [Henriciella aquimarina]|uniref:MFS transporter n=1 Tax=Henriciella aquimarina TaxID=545261 RepID=UPI000A07405D|nr:MFS transporter [Henriciella aquimarina]